MMVTGLFRSTRRRRRHRDAALASRAAISQFDRRRPKVRWSLRALLGLTAVGLTVAGFGPLYWLATAALKPPAEILRRPPTWWPEQPQLANFATAWLDLDVRLYLLNTVVLVAGAVLAQVLVAACAGYALSVLRPRFGPLVMAAMLATLFVPATVSLVALYQVITDVPGLGISMVNSPTAIWFPSAANAFNVYIVKRFFDTLPSELLEAARVDGCGPWATFRSIVVPLSRPILVVVSLFAFLATWKDFLWPLIVFIDPARQPLSVALPRLAQSANLSLLMAAMFIAALPCVLVFLVGQRYVVRGIGFTGVKG